jgi:thiamine pyrophosphokinase
MSQATPDQNVRHTVPGSRAVVVTGGAPLSPEAGSIVDDAAYVVAADSGLDRLDERDRIPHLVVGDLDSVSATALERARMHGVPIEDHPADKDATDTELAIMAAVTRGYRSVTVLSGGGDRLDHLLGWLGVLAHPALAELEHLDAWCDTTHLQILHGSRQHRWHEDQPDQIVSLIPLGGACYGVTTHGLRWSLADATLSTSSSRGVSNVIIDQTPQVSLMAGVLAVVRPHRRVAPPIILPHYDPRSS